MSAPRTPAPDRARGVNTDLWAGLLLLAFGAGGLLLVTGDSPEVWGFPRVVSIVLLVFGAGLVIKGFAAPDRRQARAQRAAAATVATFILGLVVYYALLSRLGFVATTIVLYAAATWVLRRQFTVVSAVVSLAVAAAIALVVYQVFATYLLVPLPTGAWWEALGLG